MIVGKGSSPPPSEYANITEVTIQITLTIRKSRETAVKGKVNPVRFPLLLVIRITIKFVIIDLTLVKKDSKNRKKSSNSLRNAQKTRDSYQWRLWSHRCNRIPGIGTRHSLYRPQMNSTIRRSCQCG